MRIKIDSLIIVFGLLALTFGSTVISEKYEQEKKPWFQVHRFEGVWKEEEVLSPMGPCNPCQYMLQIFSGSAQLVIFNWKDPSRIFKYPLTMPAQENFIVIERQFHIKDSSKEINLNFKPMDGYYYRIEISLLDYGLYITHEETNNRYFLFFLSTIHVLIVLMLFPLYKNHIASFVEQVDKRMTIVFIVLHAQLSTMIVFYQFTMVVSYLLYFEHFIGKIVSYSIFGLGLSIAMLQAGYMYSILQKKMEFYLPEPPESIQSSVVKKKLFRLAIFIFVFAMFLMLYPLELSIFHKEIWFSYLYFSAILFQLIASHKSQVAPFYKSLALFLVELVYLTILNNYYPILNFHQSSRMVLLEFFLSLLLVTVGGSFYVQKNVRDVRLDHSMGSDANNDRTALPSMQSENAIKSDIELEPGAI